MVNRLISLAITKSYHVGKEKTWPAKSVCEILNVQQLWRPKNVNLFPDEVFQLKSSIATSTNLTTATFRQNVYILHTDI